MRRDYFFVILTILGIWTSIVMIFGIWEFQVLKTQVIKFQVAPISKFVFRAGVMPYVIALISWTILLLVNGLVWSKILFPTRDWVEKVIFSLIIGVVIMPLNFMIPFLFGVSGRVVSSLFSLKAPEYVDQILKNHVFFLVNNHEQVYELTNVLIFLIVGIFVFFMKKYVLRKGQIV